MPANKKPKTSVRKNNVHRSNTPINFAISEKQKQWLKQVPHDALEMFKDGKGNPTDWYCLGFRLRFGIELAYIVYTEETVQQLEATFVAIENIRNRYIESGNKHWYIVESDLELLEMALEAIDTMQDETLRRHQLPATQNANAFMKKFAGLMEKQT